VGSISSAIEKRAKPLPADEQSGQLQERMSWFKDFITTAPVREGYEVSAQG
jgi:hypothetical protein